MPAHRFWSMERQINRIAASEDQRTLAISASSGSKEAYETTSKRLTLELGEPYKLRRQLFVKPEPDAKSKFEALL